MRTISPTSHCTFGRGFSTPSCICETIFITSASEIGDGRVLAPPTNPVTLLVCLTRGQVSSPISISTRTYPRKKRRSLTDFLPFLSSTTSSIGTRMRPNFSFISERSMRSRRFLSTPFSMPEYACTTYQRLPAVGANDSGVTAVAALALVAVTRYSLALSAENEVVQQPLERLVGEPQKERHDDDEGKHVAGHLQRFLARRPDDLLDLANRVLAVGDQLLAGLGREERGRGEDHQHQQRGASQPQVLLPEHVERDDRGHDQHAGDGELGLVGAGRDGLDGR